MSDVPYQGSSSWQLLPLALAMLLPSLGTSIANVALPTFRMAFEASLGEVQWVVLSYLLAVTILIVPMGRLGDQIGRRTLLLLGIATFTVASAIAAYASSLGALIAARALQGAGAATMMALTMASVSDVVPKERTGRAIGLLGAVSAVGTALGPTLGGALLSWASWPAVFAVMAAAGTMTFIIGLATLAQTAKHNRKKASFDVPGMLLLGISIGAFALATTLGASGWSWLNAGIAAVSATGVAAFIYVERRTAHPLVRLELLKDLKLNTSLLSLLLVSAIMMTTLVVGPFYLSEPLKLAPVQIGFVMSIGPAVAASVGLPAGRLVDTLGSAKVVVSGLMIVASGAALMTFLPLVFGTAGYIAGLVFITAGYGLFQAANNAGVMMKASKEQRGLISGLLGLSRNLGLIIGASAMGAVYAIGNHGLPLIHLAKGSASGLQVSFGVATALALFALLLIERGNRRKSAATSY
ncbi:MAG TPA: MFS transporter [Ramlibacter sp.]|jgi:MFS family permease